MTTATPATVKIICRAEELQGLLGLIPFNIDTLTARGLSLAVIADRVCRILTPEPGWAHEARQYLTIDLTQGEANDILNLIPFTVPRFTPLHLFKMTVDKALWMAKEEDKENS